MGSPTASIVEWIEKKAGYLILTTGWVRIGISFLAGLLSAFSMAPYYAFPILFLTFPVLVWLLDSAASEPDRGLFSRLKPAFITGWWFGFGYFLSGLWWIGMAFLVEADEFFWLLPIAVISLPAVLACFWGLAAALARLVWREDWRRLLALAASIGLMEYTRSILFTGFPWNMIGYAATPVPIAMQSASLIGVYGLSVFVVYVASLPAVIMPGSGMTGYGKKFAVFLGFCLVAAHLGYGYERLSKANNAMVEGVKLRLVQPSIPQQYKLAADKEDAIFNRLINLSEGDPAALDSLSEDNRGGNDGVSEAPADDEVERQGTLPSPLSSQITHVIWPESALPFFLTERSDALAAIGSMLPENSDLITGAVRFEPPTAGKNTGFVFNSVYVVNSEGIIVGASDKVHLVPFGEYLPFQDVMESFGIEQLTRIAGGFEPGNVVHTLEGNVGGSFLTQICYEIIFPGFPRYNGEKPSWIVNLTNDAWYGNTPGPYQHQLQAIVRGVEDGLPIIRAANSGISSVSDAYGRVLTSTRFGEIIAIDALLPVAVGDTVFLRYGSVFLFMLLGVMFLVCLPKGMSTKYNRQD